MLENETCTMRGRRIYFKGIRDDGTLVFSPVDPDVIVETVEIDGETHLTVDEAARALGASRQTVFRWIWADQLPHIKVKGVVYIRQEDVDGF